MECYSLLMADLTALKKRLSAVAEKQQAALKELTELLADPKSSAGSLEACQKTIARLAAQQQRIAQELRMADFERPERYGAYNARSGQRPIREILLDILDEVGVPSSPGTLSECAAVLAGVSIPSGRFASLRRDEQNAFGRDPLSRPTWIVPALNYQGFRAIPRLVASSVWEPERRLIGPRTLRVNHLKTVLSLLKRLETLSQTGTTPQSDRLVDLTERYARSIPGAVSMGAKINWDQVRGAAQAELEVIEAVDVEDRTGVVRELLKHPKYSQLWGLPAVIEGKAALMRKAAGR